MKQTVTVHLRRNWHWHLLVLTIAFAIAFALGAFTTETIIHGTHLNSSGVKLYHRIADRKVEQDQKGETLPPAQAAKLAASARKAEALLAKYPHPLATPEPTYSTQFVNNYSSRSAGTRPELLVVHDTESPNAPGTADVEAIRAWFNNPASQASSNFTTDATGNTVYMVPDTAKAWTQVSFNSYAISDEMIGYASQTSWPLTQLEAVARIFAREAAKYGIPIQQGVVAGCTVVRPGILMHLNLGLCGGGHHDAGSSFPMTRFLALVKLYAHPAAPKPAPKPKPKPAAKRCLVKTIQYAINHRTSIRPRLAVDGVAGPRTKAAYVKAGGTRGLKLACLRPW